MNPLDNMIFQIKKIFILAVSVLYFLCYSCCASEIWLDADLYLNFENNNQQYGPFSDNPAFYNKAFTPAIVPDFVGNSSTTTYPKISSQGIKGSCWESTTYFPAGGKTVTYNWQHSIDAISNAKSFTICGWVNTRNASKTGSNSYLFHGFANGMLKWRDDGRMQLGDKGTGTLAWYYSDYYDFNSNGLWVFFALTRNSNSIKFYSGSQSEPVTVSKEYTNLNLNPNAQETYLVIGGYSYNGTDEYAFYDLDELRMFGSQTEDTMALSQQQIEEIRQFDLSEISEPEILPPCSDINDRYIIADINFDCVVDFCDLNILCDNWLDYFNPADYSFGDIDLSGSINYKDFDSLAYNWNKKAPVATNLIAQYRNGQVFLLWNQPKNDTHNFDVYISDEPITYNNFHKAEKIGFNIEPYSANDWFDDPTLCPLATGPKHGWITQAGSNPIDPNKGLFVHIVTSNDPCWSYFAVISDSQTAADLKTGQNSLAEPIEVSVSPIQAIWQLSTRQPTATGKPLGIYLHSHTSRPGGQLTHLVFGDSSMGWRGGLPFKFKVSILPDIVLIEPYDRVWINRKLTDSETYEEYNCMYKNIESWWFGTNDKIYDPNLRLTGSPTNYTENLLLWMIDWVQNTYQTDPNKVYAFGASMGTGVQRLALQNPQRFAGVDLLVPFLDFSYVNGSENNAKRFEASCGGLNLICNDGKTLDERLDLVDFVNNYSSDLPFTIIRVGRQDKSVYWQRKPDFISFMQQQKHGLLAGWDNGTHSTAMRSHIDGFPDFREYQWFISRFALNKSYPAFSNFSLDDNPGNGNPIEGDIIGFINSGLDFSDILDTPDRYEITIYCNHPETVFPATIDVTVRRRQVFKPSAGTIITGENYSQGTSLIQSQNVTIDSDGNITFTNFIINSPSGNKMILRLIN